MSLWFLLRTGFEVKARSLETSIHVEKNHVFRPICNHLWSPPAVLWLGSHSLQKYRELFFHQNASLSCVSGGSQCLALGEAVPCSHQLRNKDLQTCQTDPG